MVSNNTSPYGTGFTVSIEARTGVSTGISAADRARTVQVAVDPEAKPGPRQPRPYLSTASKRWRCSRAGRTD